MDVEVYICPRCGHIELFEPIALRNSAVPDQLESPQAAPETEEDMYRAILQERLARAEAQSGEATASSPAEEEDLPRGSKERYKAMRRKAAHLRQSGHWQAALEVYQQIMREFPDDLQAWEEADRNIREIQENLKR